MSCQSCEELDNKLSRSEERNYVYRDEAKEARAQLAAAQLEIVALRKELDVCGSGYAYASEKTVAAPLIEALKLAHETLLANIGLNKAQGDFDTREAIAALEPWVRP